MPELQRHYSDWEIIGAPELRRVTRANGERFSPFRARPPAGAIIAPMLLWMRCDP